LTASGPSWYHSDSPCGAVAQLGARVNGIHEVMGSIPISSTNSSNDLEERPIR
jgi:hypothetical protein